MRQEHQQTRFQDIRKHRVAFQINSIRKKQYYSSQSNDKITIQFNTHHKEQSQINKQIQFLIHLPQKYPFQAPQVYSLSPLIFPRLDDSRNMFQLIFQQQWWPDCTLIQLSTKIIQFTQRIYSRNQQDDILDLITWKGLYSHQIDTETIKKMKGIKVIECLLYKKTSFLKYSFNKQLKYLGISWSNILILALPQPSNPTKMRIQKQIPLNIINSISLNEKKQKSLFKKSKKINIDESQYYTYQLIIRISSQQKQIICQITSDQNQPQQNIDVSLSYIEFNVSQNFDCLQPTKNDKQKSQNTNTILYLKNIIEFIEFRSKIQNKELDKILKIQLVSKMLENSTELEDQMLTAYYNKILKKIINQYY